TLAIQGTVGLPVVAAGVVTGSGRVANSVAIQAGGFLRPGNSPGTIVIDGGLTLGGDYDWDLNGNDNTLAGGTFDQTNAGGTVTVAAASAVRALVGNGVNFLNTFWTRSQTWPILTAAGGFADTTLPGLTVNTTAYQSIYPSGGFSVA